jgi:hypothetical protein
MTSSFILMQVQHPPLVVSVRSARHRVQEALVLGQVQRLRLHLQVHLELLRHRRPRFLALGRVQRQPEDSPRSTHQLQHLLQASPLLEPHQVLATRKDQHHRLRFLSSGPLLHRRPLHPASEDWQVSAPRQGRLAPLQANLRLLRRQLQCSRRPSFG